MTLGRMASRRTNPLSTRSLATLASGTYALGALEHMRAGRLGVNGQRSGLDDFGVAWAELLPGAHRKLLIAPRSDRRLPPDALSVEPTRRRLPSASDSVTRR